MVFKTKQKKLDCTVPLVANGSKIEQVTSTKFIGVMLDSNLCWDRHIHLIRGKIGKGIGIICKARKVLDQKSLITLYYSIVYPYLNYCVEVWGNCAHVYLASLLKLQKKLVRIITSSKYYAKTNPLFIQLKFLKVTQLYNYSISILMFKFIKGMLPNIFHDIFKRNAETVSRVTRNINKLNLPLCKTELYKQSVKFQGPKIWNDLENHLNHQCSIHTFKKSCKLFLMNENTD